MGSSKEIKTIGLWHPFMRGESYFNELPSYMRRWYRPLVGVEDASFIAFVKQQEYNAIIRDTRRWVVKKRLILNESVIKFDWLLIIKLESDAHHRWVNRVFVIYK